MMNYVSVNQWIFVASSCVHLILCSTITLQGRGYTGIVVAIDNSVSEDPELITNIKALFTNASSFLYTATNNGVYFKEVTIAVPSSWSQKPEYVSVSGNFFQSADVKVDAANPVYGDAPYTLQPGGCGEPGQYIHLTPRFIKEVDKMTEMFGKPERQLVHEWAHLRYGVFDEYGVPGDRYYPTFYIEENEVRPTTCVAGIPGWIESTTGGRCHILPNGQVDEDCVFVPDMEESSIKASIMYMPFFPSIDGFCDDATPHKEHNSKAPTRQNAECNSESTWSVISRHEDFQNIGGGGRPARATGTLTPTFRVIQPPRYDKGRYVLVLDVSGSMKGTKIELLHQSASRMVSDRIPDGAKLGIIQFSSDAKVLRSLTTVTSRTRNTLLRKLPKTASGSTAIGKGLQAAIRVLEQGNASPEAGVVILVTDGKENVRPYIEDVISEIRNKKIIINAVAFGSEASEKIENLASTTGGKAYFFSKIDGQRPPSGLDSAFLDSVTVQSDVTEQPQRIKEESFDLQQTDTHRTIYVENDLGKNTVFTVTSQYIGKVDISLRSPIGEVYDSRSPQYSKDEHRRERIQVFVPQAMGGKWTLKITRRGDVPFPVALSVTSEQRNADTKPIYVVSRLNLNEVNFPNPIKVYAIVTKGPKAVIGATVIATVDGPTSQVEKITLQDNGAGADAEKDDGIYSGYFTKYTNNGRYSVTAEVINDGQARLKSAPRTSRAQTVPRAKGSHQTKSKTRFPLSDFVLKMESETLPQDIGTPAPLFERFMDLGSFLVHNWTSNAGDIIPPSDIRDLTILSSAENYDLKTAEVTLQWTAVGDDMDSGYAASYELWASENVDSFIRNIHSGFMIPEKNITNGTLTPMLPGSLQHVTVLVAFPLVSNTLYFAMEARDKAGNASPQHRVVAFNPYVKKSIENPPQTCGVVNNHYHYHYHYHYDQSKPCLMPRK